MGSRGVWRTPCRFEASVTLHRESRASVLRHVVLVAVLHVASKLTRPVLATTMSVAWLLVRMSASKFTKQALFGMGGVDVARRIAAGWWPAMHSGLRTVSSRIWRLCVAVHQMAVASCGSSPRLVAVMAATSLCWW